jgi:hypothetical protein
MKATNKLSKIFILIIISLIALILIFAGTTVARFVFSDGVNDSAAVASSLVIMDITDDSKAIDLDLNDMIPGDEYVYDLCITNSQDSVVSLIAYKFQIVIAKTNKLPLEITLTDIADNGLTYTYDSDSQNIMTDYYYVEAGISQYYDFEILVSWDETLDDEVYQGLTDTVSVTVNWEQVV